MGTDKAVLVVGGAPLARIAANALARAGAVDVVAVGGDEPWLRAIGLRHVPDIHPVEGPLGWILTAMGSTDAAIVVVLACDLPSVTAATVRTVVGGLHGSDGYSGADVAVAVAGGRPQWLCAAWRRATAGPVLAEAFATGQRAVHRAVSALTLVEVAVPAGAAADVDYPSDLPRPAGDER
ncbi:hypothetical protein BH24ACT3_BH24ACT3_19390 [soil metagenome]